MMALKNVVKAVCYLGFLTVTFVFGCDKEVSISDIEDVVHKIKRNDLLSNFYDQEIYTIYRSGKKYIQVVLPSGNVYVFRNYHRDKFGELQLVEEFSKVDINDCDYFKECISLEDLYNHIHRKIVRLDTLGILTLADRKARGYFEILTTVWDSTYSEIKKNDTAYYSVEHYLYRTQGYENIDKLKYRYLIYFFYDEDKMEESLAELRKGEVLRKIDSNWYYGRSFDLNELESMND